MSELTLSIVIPTYRRSEIVLQTISQLRACMPESVELIIVDQTPTPPPAELARLEQLHADGSIRWLRLPQPSIPAAMNRGLAEAKGRAVLFLDDDIELDSSLIPAHIAGQCECALVSGQVLQPGESPQSIEGALPFKFNSDAPARIAEFMGGNFSVDRAIAIQLGGFDENFVGAAYRFEAEFASRYVARNGTILFTPEASIRHLRIPTGGTRDYGHHLRTSSPAHSVGEYYYLLRVRPKGWLGRIAWRPFRAIRTRHHLRNPWWIPATLLGELRGMLWALRLQRRGPKLIDGKQFAMASSAG